MLVDVGVEPYQNGYVYTLYVCERPLHGVVQIPLGYRENHFDFAVVYLDPDNVWNWMPLPTESLASRYAVQIPISVEAFICNITLKMSLQISENSV